MIGYLSLRISPFLGKIACPIDGVATSTKIIDGSVVQLSDVLRKEEAAARRRQQNDIGETALTMALGIQNPSEATIYEFNRKVQGFMDSASLPTTLTGEPSFGAPRAGGITAFESHVLVASLEETQRATYGLRRVPAWCKQSSYSEDASTIFAVAGARADEQRNGEHLIRSKQGGTVSSLAKESECAVFSAFLASNTDFQDVIENLDGVSGAALSDFWDKFVDCASDAASRKAGARGKGPSKGSPSKNSSPGRRNAYRTGASYQRAELLCFFKEMLRLTFLGDSHMKKMDQGKGRDYGVLASFCTCGLSITQSRQVLLRSEHAVHWMDSLAGSLNHWTNAVLGDYCCPSMLAGHCVQRFPAAAERMGGAQRMGGVWNISQQDRWDRDREDLRRVDAAWLNSPDLTRQSCGDRAKLTSLLDPAVNRSLTAPSLQAVNPVTGSSTMYLLLDSLHSNQTSHARGTCGNNRRVNLKFSNQKTLDDAAAERHWAEWKAKPNHLYGWPAGTKLMLQHILDDHSSFQKVYEDDDFGGVLMDMWRECNHIRVVAYDSLQRFRYVCGECGIAYGSCLHTGDRPGWDAVNQGASGSSTPITFRQIQCATLMQAVGLPCSSLRVPESVSSSLRATADATVASSAAAAAAATAAPVSVTASANGGSSMHGDEGAQGSRVDSIVHDGSSGTSSNSGVKVSHVQDDLQFLNHPSSYPGEGGGRVTRILADYRIPRGRMHDMLRRAVAFLGQLVSHEHQSMPPMGQCSAPVEWLQLVDLYGVDLRSRIDTLQALPPGMRLPIEFAAADGHFMCAIV